MDNIEQQVKKVVAEQLSINEADIKVILSVHTCLKIS